MENFTTQLIYLFSMFQIWIHWIRNRIQAFFVNSEPDPDLGF